MITVPFPGSCKLRNISIVFICCLITTGFPGSCKHSALRKYHEVRLITTGFPGSCKPSASIPGKHRAFDRYSFIKILSFGCQISRYLQLLPYLYSMDFLIHWKLLSIYYLLIFQKVRLKTHRIVFFSEYVQSKMIFTRWDNSLLFDFPILFVQVLVVSQLRILKSINSTHPTLCNLGNSPSCIANAAQPKIVFIPTVNSLLLLSLSKNTTFSSQLAHTTSSPSCKDDFSKKHNKKAHLKYRCAFC